MWRLQAALVKEAPNTDKNLRPWFRQDLLSEVQVHVVLLPVYVFAVRCFLFSALPNGLLAARRARICPG